MKKYLLMSLVVIGATVASAASVPQNSYIYWMGSAPEERSSSWDYAQLMYTNDGKYDGSTVLAALDRIDKTSTDSYWADISGLTADNLSFYIEYMSEGDGSDTVAFSSEMLSYQTLLDNGKIKNSITTMGTPVTFNVPEPTSGMMLLLGMGLLALKRKKA